MLEHDLEAAIAFLFGLVIGSFLNVCIYRLPRDLSVIAPRSFCPGCEHPIAWYDNVPLFSFLWLRSRCRHCGLHISVQYPLVELVTASLFAAIAARFGLSFESGKWFVFTAVMVVLFVTDLQTRLLPDELTLGGLAVGLTLASFVPLPGVIGELFFSTSSPMLQSLINSITGAFVLSVPFWLFSSIYARLRGILPPGLGDIKLLAAIGAFLGIESGLLTLMIGSVSGVLIGFGYMLGTRQNPRTYGLPFGSFLCGASLLVLFFGQRIIQFWWA
jgi:leader peptidase (prepilin peptidase) / N-methyltransferase